MSKKKKRHCVGFVEIIAYEYFVNKKKKTFPRPLPRHAPRSCHVDTPRVPSLIGAEQIPDRKVDPAEGWRKVPAMSGRHVSHLETLRGPRLRYGLTTTLALTTKRRKERKKEKKKKEGKKNERV